jgi:hypothetical protein
VDLLPSSGVNKRGNDATQWNMLHSASNDIDLPCLRGQTEYDSFPVYTWRRKQIYVPKRRIISIYLRWGKVSDTIIL